MADFDDPQNDELEVETNEDGSEQAEPDDSGEGEGAEQPDEEADVIGFGDAPSDDDASTPEWVRDVRKRNRELERELSELKKAQKPAVEDIGPKPTYESCDFDDERFAAELEAWTLKSAEQKARQSEAEKAQEEAQKAWRAKQDTFSAQKSALRVPDFDSAFDEASSVLSEVQMAILIDGTENKAAFLYALGRNPDKLRELGKIKNPVEFAFAAAKLEGKMTVTRKPTTQPERRVTGSATISGNSDAKLKRLEEEAERTGNRTDLIAYRKKMRGGK